MLREDVRPGSAIKTYDCDNLNNPDTAPEAAWITRRRGLPRCLIPR